MAKYNFRSGRAVGDCPSPKRLEGKGRAVSPKPPNLPAKVKIVGNSMTAGNGVEKEPEVKRGATSGFRAVTGSNAG